MDTNFHELKVEQAARLQLNERPGYNACEGSCYFGESMSSTAKKMIATHDVRCVSPKRLASRPELRFPQFSGEWVEKRLGELTSKIGSGSTPRGGDQAYQKSGVRFIRSQNVNGNRLTLDEVYISDEINKKMKGSMVKPNDILLNITGASIGRSCVVPADFTVGNVNQHVCIIRLPENDPGFVQSFLASHKGQKLIYQGQTGSGREGLNFPSVALFKLGVPSLDEQKKIAAFLSAVDGRIEGLEKKRDLLKDYKKGLMQKLFNQSLRFENGKKPFSDWEEKRLGEVVESISNGMTCDQNLEKKGVMVTRIETISKWKVDLSKAGWVETSEDISRFKLLEGDLLFSHINSVAHIGKIVRVGSGCDLYHGMNLLNIRVDRSDVSSRFLCYLLGSRKFKTLFERLCNKAVNQASINQTSLKKVQVSLPCLEEQRKIAECLSAVDRKIGQVETQVSQTRAFKQGLLQKMFV